MMPACLLSQEEYGCKFFANDSRPGGILKTPGKMAQDVQDRLKTSWQDAHTGDRVLAAAGAEVDSLVISH